MKKTLISVLLIVSLLSTALFSVVFAAYSVTDTGRVTASVSAFGVNVVVTESTGDDLVLKPGSSGTLIAVDASGAPTVNAKLTYAATVTIGNWLIDEDDDGEKDDFYCPIVFTIGETVIDGSTKTAATLKTALEEALTFTDEELTIEENVATTYDKTVAWAWADSTDAVKNGNLTAAATIQIELTATIVQYTPDP